MGARNQHGITTQCNHCGYTWLYDGNASVTSCPKCGYRVRLRSTRSNEFNQTPGNITPTRNGPPRYY